MLEISPDLTYHYFVSTRGHPNFSHIRGGRSGICAHLMFINKMFIKTATHVFIFDDTFPESHGFVAMPITCL